MAKSGDIVIYEDSLTLKSEFGIIIKTAHIVGSVNSDEIGETLYFVSTDIINRSDLKTNIIYKNQIIEIYSKTNQEIIWDYYNYIRRVI